MTDNAQELDEVLSELRSGTINFDDEAKKLILDWHNKQVENYKGIIKMSDTYKFETGEVYYSEKAVNKQIEAVLDRIESQQGKIDLGSYSDMQRAILPEAIEAERNKLKESSDE